ncbi:hypothetical protein GEMRC1_007996 [Eukaryota sp. GEM-RC1]
MSEHKFWSTQPVPQSKASTLPEGPISIPSTVSSKPLPLPPGFEWVELDLLDPSDKRQIYELLSHHYVEDDDSMFRFDYSSEFISWALTPPGYIKEYHIGIRSSTGALLAFISGVPQKLIVRDNEIESVDINFLCVHSQLRSKRLAPVLIKEITRRVNLNGVYFAAFTAGIALPTPYSDAQYFHRPLNIPKLVEIDFLSLPAQKVSTMTKLYSHVPYLSDFKNIMREMEEKDVASVTEILNIYLAKFVVHPVFTPEEVSHYFLPIANVVSSFVFVDENDHVTDFISLYHLPSSVLRATKEENKHLNAAYLYYYASSAVPLVEMVKCVLNWAKDAGVDVFNCLSVMDNREFLKPCLFGPGDGNLNYYMFNWRLNPLKDCEVGLVLQ